MNKTPGQIKKSLASPDYERVPIPRKPPRYRVRTWAELYGYDAPIPSVATRKTAITAMSTVDSRGDAGARRVLAIKGVIQAGKKDVALATSHRKEK